MSCTTALCTGFKQEISGSYIVWNGIKVGPIVKAQGTPSSWPLLVTCSLSGSPLGGGVLKLSQALASGKALCSAQQLLCLLTFKPTAQFSGLRGRTPLAQVKDGAIAQGWATPFTLSWRLLHLLGLPFSLVYKGCDRRLMPWEATLVLYTAVEVLGCRAKRMSFAGPSSSLAGPRSCRMAAQAQLSAGPLRLPDTSHS